LEDYQEIEFVLREQDYQAEIQVCGNEVKVYNVMMYANHLLFV